MLSRDMCKHSRSRYKIIATIIFVQQRTYVYFLKSILRAIFLFLFFIVFDET